MTQYYSKFTTITIEWQAQWPVSSMFLPGPKQQNYTAFQGHSSARDAS